MQLYSGFQHVVLLVLGVVALGCEVFAFVDALRARGLEVATGVFGADMAVELVNDGPVTILLESVPDA